MRYPRLTPVEMTPRQHQIAAEIAARRGADLGDPYAALIYSPDVANLVQPLWQYLRLNLRVPEPLRLIAVLMTSARYNAAELFLRANDSINTGLSDDKIKALSAGRRPAGMTTEEEMVHEFCSELLETGHVKDATFGAMTDRFDRAICIELTGLCANTRMSTMMLKITGTRFSQDEALY
jgi:4-carboxymuconolactone decarboxylase